MFRFRVGFKSEAYFNVRRLSTVTHPIIGLIILLTLGLSISIPLEIARRKRIRPYLDRACNGASWKQRFPSASKSEIRDFLGLFVRAFAFSRKRQLAFSPDDKIMEIYRALYPPGSLVDSLELESFARDFKKTYGIDVLGFWRDDVTLGELFARGTKVAS